MGSAGSIDGREALSVKNNKGFSLVELLVVLAIMVIVIAAGAGLFLNWRSWNITDCAKKVDSALDAAKVDAMSKETGKVTFKRGSNGICEMEVYGEDSEALGDEHVKMYYSDTDGHSNIEITGATTLTISYDRATGGFKEIGTNASGDKVYCTQIRMVRKDREIRIQLVKSTGKHYIQE